MLISSELVRRKELVVAPRLSLMELKFTSGKFSVVSMQKSSKLTA